jgi:NitT/TauT family transport system permease protein
MNLFPGRVLGAELASIFAVFTSQAWNMAFSFYQSLRTVPLDLDEASRAFRFSSWQRFWRVEAPFAVPGLVWNMMMSMSGGWFFVVASEAISVGDEQIALPGIGSYVALAIERQNLGAIGWALLAMTLVILLYDQLMFRPLVVWADHFRSEQAAAQSLPHSWFLTVLHRARFLHAAGRPLGLAAQWTLRAPIFNKVVPGPRIAETTTRSRVVDGLWYAGVMMAALFAASIIIRYIATELNWSDVLTVLRLGSYTLLRVAVLIALASIIWVPIGVMIGLRPKLAEAIQPLAQFLAAFPANLLFPFAVITIVRFDLNPDIWLSLLMILGTQWYILFNVIAGATAYPTDFLEAASNFQIHGWKWWRNVILPGIFPYYVTGALTASGGAWNASIVAESVSWGKTHLTAQGLGAYIAEMTTKADYPRIVLGIAVMSLYVIFFNRVLWRRLYRYGERHSRLD